MVVHHSPYVAPAVTAALSLQAEGAALAFARLDERLVRSHPVIQDGFRARSHALEAQALIGLAGGVASLEDIVLNEAGMDVRTPTTDVVRAVAHLALRCRFERKEAAEALSPPAVRALLGVSAEPSAMGGEAVAKRSVGSPWSVPDPAGDDADDDEFPAAAELAEDDPLDEGVTSLDPLGGLLAEADGLLARSRRSLDRFNDLSTEAGRSALALTDPSYDEAGRLERWLRLVEATESRQAALAAAMAIDGWLALEPSQSRGELGFLLSALLLRKRLAAGFLLPALATGYRRGRFRWGPHLGAEERLGGLVGAFSAAAALGNAELDRLTLARELLLRKCVGRSKNSRLGDLVDLFVTSPLVTVQLAARRLGVSAQAVDAMLRELGDSLPRELTGRKRYRAWGIL